ncbi:beta-ketoacyl-[acyl-carrier-protein] synthase family protein [Massilibacteroides vaginae]|uniref:beta-ketoacyl-[acyl-carrier-protein] synthase family protein n=1 Tax=Massilibacteroides vaginae TaxID=1673718 RepID=UPI000A1CAD44|nr:beta-ketoacyl-[acyl-carrier-protein] synthase family protein [Massilibacteroides vaginae]
MNVCITGIGCISGIGNDVEAHLQAFRQGKSGLGKVTLFPTNHHVPVSEVKLSNEGLKERLGLPSSKVYSRTSLLGLSAAHEALKDSGVTINSGLRIGLISSTSTGGMDVSENHYPTFRENPTKGHLRYFATHDAGDSTEKIADHLGITGMRTTISTACSSAANSLLLAARLIRQGILDVAIAGGTDALCKFTLNGFASLMILDNEPCRPFDNTRAGLNLGEGAGYVVLQSEATIKRKPYATLSGYANANDAYHQTASSAEGTGAFLAMKAALCRAGVSPSQVDYINGHGTGTPNNDASESTAINRLFEGNIPPFSSTKAFTGHTLGAAGGIEAVFSVLSIEYGILYPNLNFSTPMEENGMIPVLTYKEGEQIENVLSNSFGFGGNNTSLLFQRYKSTLC